MSYPYKLEPCPFCGGSAEIYEPWPHADVKEFYVVHEADEYSDCPADTRGSLSWRSKFRRPSDAAASWNCRLGVK
jgi:hypothetical protein